MDDLHDCIVKLYYRIYRFIICGALSLKIINNLSIWRNSAFFKGYQKLYLIFTKRDGHKKYQAIRIASIFHHFSELFKIDFSCAVARL